MKQSLITKALLLLLAVSMGAFLTSCDEDDHDHDHDEEHLEVEGWVIYDGETEILRITDESTGTPELMIDQGLKSYELKIIDHDGEEEEIGHDGDDEYTVEVEITDDNIATGSYNDASHSLEMNGKAEGSTTMIIKILHENHEDARTPDITLTVKAASPM
ncbi:MAG: hypothetical protein Kapaf2KO_19200 [Candidatus Kapaibacteriales bacterium]